MELEEDNPAARELLAAFALLMKKIEQRPRLAAALADPRNSNEAFYSIMFGDVEALLDRVAAIDKALTEGIADATGRMNLQTSQLLDAGSRYEKMIGALVEESKRSIIKAAQAAKQEQLRELEQAMTAAAGAAVQDAISQRMGESLTAFNKALAESVKGINTATQKVNAAAGNVKSTAKRWLLIAPAGGVVAVLIFFAGQWYVGRNAVAAAPQLTLAQQEQIAVGSGVQRAWPKLDQKAKATIQSELQQR